MKVNMATLKAVVKYAERKTASGRWQAAIITAAREIIAGNTPRRLPNGHAVTSRTDDGAIYEVNGRCQCRAADHGKPCWHRTAVRLWEIYEMAEDIRQRWSVRGQTFIVTLTPGGELVIEDTITEGCISLDAIKAIEAEEKLKEMLALQ